MEILRYTDSSFAGALKKLLRKAIPQAGVENTVREILRDVREKGDEAVVRYTERFGGPRLPLDGLLETRKAAVAAATRSAVAKAHRNVLKFAKKSLRKNWEIRNAQGGITGERFSPFERVGIYVPGGTAPLISTAIMTVTLAAAAGVPEIVVTTPADASGKINDALLFALEYAGATEVYKIGGAQAIAALAYGTQSIRGVQKIAGPGNAYVVEAKRQVFGEVSIDLLPGPSEVLVLADGTANAAWAAAELLAQAEHGKGSGIVFVTTSPALLAAVHAEIQSQTMSLSRREHLEGVLAAGAYLILVEDMAEAIRLCNAYAPEHCAILTADPEATAEEIHSAGALFLGAYSPVAAGDFMAGPSHTLPTGGGGKSFPGLMADMFQRRTSWVKMDRAALQKSLPIIEAFSALEGLDAHGRSASIRLEETKNP